MEARMRVRGLGCKALVMGSLLALAACSGGDKGGDDTGGGDGGGEGGGDGGGGGACADQADYINVTQAAVGDLTGFEGGFEGAGAWWTQTVDTSKQGVVPMAGVIEDFETNDGVPDATLDIWFSDTTSGVPDQSVTSDSSGNVSGEAPTCTPITYRVTTDPALAETKTTFEAHQVTSAGPLDDEYFNSVSTTTYSIIPSLLGVSPDADKGIVAGTAYDINEDPIEGAQIVITDDAGCIPESLTVKYFVDDFPNRNQPNTSADGLWVAVNIPAGEWNAEMFISDGAGGHIKLGSTRITVEADSININNVYPGYGDGVKYPADCVTE
jgi:hypothetical protein